jgi:TonB family protein
VIGLLRPVAASLKAVESRHWLGLGASVALHLGVLLGWKPEAPPEPQPISFEIALEPSSVKPLPEAKKKPAAKKLHATKLAKQHKAKEKKVARKAIAKREPQLIEATWRGETKSSPDAPALVLPDARALGLAADALANTLANTPANTQAAMLASANASGKPQLARTERESREAAASVAGNESGAGLSEPGVPHAAADSAARSESGLALANSTSLSASQGLNPGTGGAGAQANTSAVSLAGAAGSGRSGDSQGGLHASASPQAALSAPTGAGMQAAAVTATAATAPGVGSTTTAPQTAALAQGGSSPTAANQPRSGGAGLTGSQASVASVSINAGAGYGAVHTGGVGGVGGVGVEAGASRRGRGQETNGKLGVAAVASSALMGPARTAATPGRTGQSVAAVALAPGEPGGSPGLAVTLGPVLVSLPVNPYLTTRPGQSGVAMRGEPSAGIERTSLAAVADVGSKGAGAMPFAATASGGGGMPSSGRTASPTGSRGAMMTRPGQAGSTAVLNAAGESGRAPVILQATHAVPVKVVRPDTEIQRLDVLAPSNYCPLPLPGHTQPDNRAPMPDRNIAEQPAYALDNPRIDYPFLANVRGVEGRVTVRVEVLANGRPGKMWLKQSSGSGILDQNAQEQLKQWRFVPARKSGQPVAAWIDVPVQYRLSEARP